MALPVIIASQTSSFTTPLPPVATPTTTPPPVATSTPSPLIGITPPQATGTHTVTDPVPHTFSKLTLENLSRELVFYSATIDNQAFQILGPSGSVGTGSTCLMALKYLGGRTLPQTGVLSIRASTATVATQTFTVPVTLSP